MAETSNIRKQELSTCGNFMNLRTENYLMELSSSKIYTKKKYYQKYIQCNVYNRIFAMGMQLYAGSLEV